MALCPAHTCSLSIGAFCHNQSLRSRSRIVEAEEEGRLLHSCWVWPWSSLDQRGPVENISPPKGQYALFHVKPITLIHSTNSHLGPDLYHTPGPQRYNLNSFILAQCKLAVRSSLGIIIYKHSI